MSILAPTAPEVQPIAPEWIGQSEPTPVELLIDPTDQAEAWVCEEPAPRYVVEPRHSEKLGRVIFHVVDRMEDNRFVRWSFSRAEAEADASDLNAEDFEPLLIGGLPWFETPCPVSAWDGPRFTPTAI